MRAFIMFLIVSIAVVLGLDCCTHHNDYKVAAEDLTIIGNNLIGDVMAVTTTNDTVFVYGKFSSLLYRADTSWQTKFHYLTAVGFTTDSVVVKPY